MKTIILAAAVASLAMTGMAYADASDQQPAVHGRSIDYGESPSGRNIETTQPSGGKVADNIAAPTGNISGSVTGAANMNGPLRNGQPLDPFWQERNLSPYDD